MSDLDRSIEVLGSKIDELAIQVGSLTETVTRVERAVERQSAIADKQAENIAQLIALAQQQQATVDRLLATN
jgi:uncharacterized protein YigA (DUF484 family)